MRATGRLSAMFVLAGWALCASTGAPWAADALAGLDPGAIALTDCPDEPGCPAIVLLDETTVNNDYLRARIQKRRALKIFTAEGVASCSDLNLYSKAGEENIRNLKGSTILPDGRRIELSRDNVQVKTAFKRGRTRILLKSATFPGVVPGSIVEFSYDVITENAAKYDGYLWDIQERLPVLSARFDLKPGGVAFDWLTLGGESVPVEHDHPFPGIHHFRATNVPALPHEPFAPSDEAWRARMHFSHPVSRVGWLVGYQMALIDELRRFMEKRGAAQSLVKSLLTDGQSRMQKVGTLYRYVQEKVQPGGDGVDENISVDDVIERGNGTELERTMLFVALLSEAGIDAGLVSIASRDAFPLNTSVPTADPFDTFAAAVKEETSWSYYDPATPHCPFGMVAPGKQGWVPNGVIVKPDRTRITESITIPSIAAARNFETWESVARWYAGVASAQVVSDSAIRKMGAQLAADGAGPGGAVASVARFTRSLRYLDTAPGRSVAEPHPAPVILANRFGDCEDKAILTIALLKEVGVEAWPLLVLTRDDGTIDPGFPGVGYFNHVIVAVRPPESLGTTAASFDAGGAGRLIAFDPTASMTALGDLPYYLQGTRGVLAHPEKGGLVELPRLDAARSARSAESRLSFGADGLLQVAARVRHEGQYATEWRHHYETVRADRRAEEVMRRLSARFGRVEVKRLEVAALDRVDEPLGVDLDLSVKPQSPSASMRMVPVSFLLPTRASPLPGGSRRNPVLIEESYTESERTSLELPEGWSVVSKLPAEEAGCDAGAYRLAARQEGTALIIERELRVKAGVIEPGAYEAVRAFFDKVARADAATVLLEKSAP